MTGVPVPRVSPGRVCEHGVVRAWTVSVSLGEPAGLCAPRWLVVSSVRAPRRSSSERWCWQGVVEGAILGLSQARVLRQRLDGFSEAGWVVGTAVAAAGAWHLGMLPSTFHGQWSTWPTLLTVIVATLLGTVVLGSVGVAQWWTLRRHVLRAARWIGTTAAGWGAGLVVFMAVATPPWRRAFADGQRPDGSRPALVSLGGSTNR